MKIKRMRLLSSILAVTLASSMLVSTMTVGAEEYGINPVKEMSATANSYNEYLVNMGKMSPATTDVILDTTSASFDEDIKVNPDFKGKPALVWEKGTGTANWTFEVEKDAYYNLILSYASVNTGVDFTFSVLVDGKAPFEESSALTFPRFWENANSEFKKDTFGNQLTPEQKEIDGYAESFAKSATGVTVEPYAFYLTAGTHTISVGSPEQAVALSSVKLAAPEQVLSYAELSKNYDIANVGANTIVIEGEKADVKTTSKLTPKSDNADAGMSPLHSMYTMLNYIGGTSWQTTGETLTWNFHAEKSGYYSLGVRYRQSDVINAVSPMPQVGSSTSSEMATLLIIYGSRKAITPSP